MKAMIKVYWQIINKEQKGFSDIIKMLHFSLELKKNN